AGAPEPGPRLPEPPADVPDPARRRSPPPGPEGADHPRPRVSRRIYTMQANCPQCQPPVAIDDARAPEKPFGLKCPKCGGVVRFPGRPAATSAPAGAATPVPAAAPAAAGRPAPDG